MIHFELFGVVMRSLSYRIFSEGPAFQLSREDGSLITGEETGFLLYNNKRTCEQSRYKNGFVFNNVTAHAICSMMGFDAAVAWGWKSKPRKLLTWSRYYFQCPQDIWSTDCINIHDRGCSYLIQLKCSLSCSQGMYLNHGKCVHCPHNTYTPTRGRLTSCYDCPDGSTSPPNSSNCICEKGSYWLEDSCSPCTSDICNCSKGLIWNGDDIVKGTCVPCEPGTYRGENMDLCKECPPGSTSTEGQDYCVCRAGMFWDGTSCVECEVGTVSQAGARRCISCPSGITSSDINTSETISSNRLFCDCPDGQIWSWENETSGNCTSCPSGTYKKSMQNYQGTNENSIQNYSGTNDNFVQEYRGTNDSSRRNYLETNDISEQNHLEQDSCTACPAEASSVTGSSSCICPEGTIWSETKLNCVNCNSEQVSQAGSLKCTDCPEGREDGATCLCPAGWVWSWIEKERGECLCLNISLCQSDSDSDSDSDSESESESDSDSDSEHSELSDNSESSSIVLILVASLGIITVVCVSFIGLYIRERKKNCKKNKMRIFFNQEQHNADSEAVAGLQSQYHDLIVESTDKITGENYTNLERKSRPRKDESYSRLQRKTAGISTTKDEKGLSNKAARNDDVYNTLNEGITSQQQDGKTRTASDEMYNVLENPQPSSAIDGAKDSAEDLYSVPWTTKTTGQKEITDDPVYNTLHDETVYNTLDEEPIEDGDYADTEEILRCKEGGSDLYSTLNHAGKEERKEEEEEGVYRKLDH